MDTPNRSIDVGERPLRELAKRAAGRGRTVYAAGVLALTDPGPAAAGVVVTDAAGRVLAQRSHYLGYETRSKAAAQALLTAARLALVSGLEAPVFRLDDSALAEALRGSGGDSGTIALIMPALHEALDLLPGHSVEVVSTGANVARATALTPLVDWLPDRTRRSEDVRVRPIGNHHYEVESASQPGVIYHVTLVPPGEPHEGDPVQCECADFLYRHIPCKHLLAVARETGAVERLFYPDQAEAAAREQQESEEDRVTSESIDSFPASDPPSWTSERLA